MVSLVLVGCGELPQASPLPQVRGPRFGNDTVMAAPVARQEALGAPSPQAVPQVLFLDFSGVQLSPGSPDNAPALVSEIAGATVPSFNPIVNAPLVTRQQAIDSVVDRVRTFYAPFNVQVTASLPGAGPYTMIAIGGSHGIAGLPSGVAGVSPLDCTNANHNNVVFDFSDDQTPDFGGLVSVAITAAHESGHSFGLEHTVNPLDIMYSVATPAQMVPDLFHIGFGKGNFSGFNAGEPSGTTEACGRADPLDNPAILNSTVGANTSRTDTTAPTLTWPFPIVANVPTSFPLRATATDDVAVVRVEVYKNLELVAVLTGPPYNATINAASGETFYLTLEAIDAAANRTSITKPFAADAMNPALCPDGTCPTGQTCKQGLCALPLGSACTLPVQCNSSNCKKPAGMTTTVCTQACAAGASHCPPGFDCGTDNLCTPSTMMPQKMNGAACAAPLECTSGRCDGLCVPACETTPCDSASSCAAVPGGMGCVAMSSPSPTPKPASGGCDFGGAGEPSLAALLLALGWLLGLAFRPFRARVESEH